MTDLELRPAGSCRYDLVALGEVMLRLDPGSMRIATTRHFVAWEGGGEYNVARGLRRCFGLETAIVTALVDNPVGRLIEDLICQGGVDRSYISWLPSDGVGRDTRNGLNFTERGFGARGAVGCSDRGHTAASQMRPGVVDWDDLFGRVGVRWLHCGGIFCALSDTTASVALEAFAAARRHGTVISYDLNYRESLWRSIGGPARAAEVNRDLVANVDLVIGNEEDFQLALGFEPATHDENLLELDPEAYGTLFARVQEAYPNLRVLGATLRAVHSASSNDWGAVARFGGDLRVSTMRRGLEIYDRVGGGDSFASGLIYGLLAGLDPQECLEYGAAHGALAMTTPGDVSMATLAEVRRLAGGGSARVVR
jgi:2-dehydro-3-deoxygluconokinase